MIKLKNTRNYSFDFFRVIFTLIICFHHFQGIFNENIIKSGYIGVEFFFILSGFLLYKHLKANTEDTAKEYTIKKLKKLYPEYIFAFIVCFLLQLATNKDNSILDFLFKPFSEILLIQNIGIFKGNINYPLWYLSVLIIGGFIIYECIKKDEKLFTRIIFPIIIVFNFSLLNSLGNGLENWETINGIYMPLLRGIADICIGVLLSSFMEDNDMDSIYKKIDKYYILEYIIELISCILLGYLVIFKTNYEMYSIILIAIIIFACNYKNSLINKLFNSEIYYKFGRITYSMYVNHASIIIIMSFLYRKIFKYNISEINITLIYFALLIIYSIISKHIIKTILEKKKIKSKTL